jgi:hypothetical protein
MRIQTRRVSIIVARHALVLYHTPQTTGLSLSMQSAPHSPIRISHTSFPAREATRQAATEDLKYIGILPQSELVLGGHQPLVRECHVSVGLCYHLLFPESGAKASIGGTLPRRQSLPNHFGYRLRLVSRESVPLAALRPSSILEFAGLRTGLTSCSLLGSIC